jgi:hypothetical protein
MGSRFSKKAFPIAAADRGRGVLVKARTLASKGLGIMVRDFFGSLEHDFAVLRNRFHDYALREGRQPRGKG